MTVVRVEPFLETVAEAYRGTFAAMEGRRRSGEQLPPGWEGIYFPFAVELADLRPDGTPARDGVIPEIDLPRRLYAGETTRFIHPITLGEEVTLTTTLGKVVEKTGSNGRLVFVDIEREYLVAGEMVIRSVWHDVFLDAPDPQTRTRPPRTDPRAADSADWVDHVVLDARALFRFSALTFNTHLIHYDRGWARGVEGLPDLLVHGPLIRILLIDAARRHTPDRSPAKFTLRVIEPMLVDAEVRIAGQTDENSTRVTALDADDVVLATAEVVWS